MFFLNLSFQQEVYLIIIEKLIIGAILIFFGIMAKWIFERFKNKQTLVTELNRLRVDKIAECWSIHSKYSKLLNEFIDTLDKYRYSEKSDQEIVELLSPRIEMLKETKNEVELTTASHRFWLGDNIYEKALEFNKSFPNFCDVFHRGKFDRCVELKMDMDEKMLDVDDVLELLNQKINSKMTIYSN